MLKILTRIVMIIREGLELQQEVTNHLFHLI